MGTQVSYLKQPNANKEVVDGQVPCKARFGACGMQGWRRGMEDAHLAIPDLTGDGRFSLFGVFDGHGGCAIARFAVRHLPDLLVATEAFKTEDYAAALTAAFLAVDERMLTPDGRAELRELDAQGCGRVPFLVSRKQWAQYWKGPGAKKVGVIDMYDEKFKAADDEVLIDPGAMKEATPENHGSTAVVTLIIWEKPGDSAATARMFVANAGDSRCIIGRSSGDKSIEAFAMSEDHKPELPSEAARIKAGGGHIQVMPGGARVQGDLNLSRALGDFRHKTLLNVPPEKQIVTASPEVRECSLGPEKRLLVLGCDGIWERNTNQKLMEKLHSRLSASGQSSRPLLSDLGAEICDASLCPSMTCMGNPNFDGSGCDNMTILIIEFDKAYPAPGTTAEKEESETESFPMSSLVADILETVAETTDFNTEEICAHSITESGDMYLEVEDPVAESGGELTAGQLAAAELEVSGAIDDGDAEPDGKKRRLET